jgi:1-acyl-sn-glycerol-3-phosphate acyltransferase
VAHRRIGFWYRLAVALVKPSLLLLVRRDWRGRENIPARGGVIIVVNHVSYLDPLVLAHFLYDAGRLPRYLAKAELFSAPVVGRLMRGTGQIPVARGSSEAMLALRDALSALERGECLVVYPEGTITSDPAGWPMAARTGVARLALRSSAPVVPVGQWGAQEILPAHARRPRLLPRKVMHVAAGPPVDLSPWRGQSSSVAVLREVTDQVMGQVRELVAELRGIPAPAQAYDPRPARAEPRP